jgi:quercetin dioxygenase-like cupin family protein
MHYEPDSSKYRELVPGVAMKALTFGDNSLLCEFRIKQGAVMPAHQHPHEQTGYLVRGSLRFFGDEGEFVAVPGHSWSFKGGVVHGAEALADTVLVEVFSPVRQDYLPPVPGEQPD